jgi:hypothetical protein
MRPFGGVFFYLGISPFEHHKPAMKSSLRLVKSMDYALCERDISFLKIGHGKGMECRIKGDK